MENKLIYIIIIIFAVIFLIKLFNIEKYEHLTPSSDEAIQNLASLYNKDQLTVTDATVTGNFNLLPKGIIVAWTGNTAPYGWALCDGQNGTPDLRGRFIYGFGAGRGGTMNARGGAEVVSLNVDQMPSHNHGFSVHSQGDGYCSRGNSRACRIKITDRSEPGGDDRPQDFSVGGSGGNKPHENMPPYHVLAYIMKL